MITAADGVFRESEPGVFTRKCTGFEAGCAALSGNGFGHGAFSANVKLLKDVSPTELKEKVERAMVRLRHLAPLLACSISQLSPAQEFQFRYEVPKSLDDARRWAATVVFLCKEPLAFEKANGKIAETVWWAASDGRFTHELHIHPNPNESKSWTFTLSADHSNIDGRSAWMILDKLFTFLEDELVGQAPPLEGLRWGEETTRLPASPELAPSIAQNGVPDEFPSIEGFAMPTPPEGFVPFLYSCKTDEIGEDGAYTARVALTKQQTSSFHQLCKTHGRTITQAVTALVNLSNIEWALRVASSGEPKEDVHEKNIDVFNKATHFSTAHNAVNARGLLPESYRTLDSEYSTPFNCLHGFPLSFPLEPYRKMITIDHERRTVVRAPVGGESEPQAVFWDELAKGVADAWAKEDRTLGSYKFETAIFTSLSSNPNIDLDLFKTAAPMYSSCGDMTRLNILEKFRRSSPSAGGAIDSDKELVVEDLTFAPRYNQPGVSCCFMQYDGTFSIIAFTGKRFWKKPDFDLYLEVLKGWIEVLL